MIDLENFQQGPKRTNSKQYKILDNFTQMSRQFNK